LVGLEQIGDRDGRIALYLTESLSHLLPPPELQTEQPPLSEKAERILDVLAKNGASFFANIHAALGAGFQGETNDALWELVWSGRITNDTFHPLRAFHRLKSSVTSREHSTVAGIRPGAPEFLRHFRSRQSLGGAPVGGAQGRWSLVSSRVSEPISATKWSANVAQQLLTRHGIVMRETAIAENIPRGLNTIYPALKTMEESGWVRRGMFVAGMGASQFAAPSAVDMLRSLRAEPAIPEVIYLAASDPANPYGALLPWPSSENEVGDATHHTMSRTSGAGVILINGALAAFLRRRNPALRVFLPESEPERSLVAGELTKKLAEIAVRWQCRRSGLLIGEINDAPAREHFLARFLKEAGFVDTALGFQMRRVAPRFTPFVSGRDANDDAEEEQNERDISESA